MPFPKRRKLSVDGQNGQESTRNRLATTVKKSAKHAKSEASGSSSKAAPKQVERRSSRQERKVEATTTATPTTTTASTTGPANGTTAVAGSQGKVSSSGRIIKLTKKGNSFQVAAQLLKQAASAGAPKINKAGVTVKRAKNVKKRWEKWSKFEQDAFFEGLFEYGKDFDAIQNFISIRSRKRGVSPTLIKSKEQVRHMYYRTWQKITKHVHMDEALKKETQELYGLVNYAVFRRVFKSLNAITAGPLNELIHTGISKVRKSFYGKKKKKTVTKYLRTPVCNALKKLNNITETKEELTDVHQQVTVEMTPRNTAAWVRVHNMSQNPRVRFHLSSNRSLASILEHLRKKWISKEDKLRRSLGGEVEDGEELVVFPHHSYTLSPVTIANQREETSVDLITLSHYRENVLDSPVAGSKTLRRIVEDFKLSSDNSSDVEPPEPNVEPYKPLRVGVKVNLFQKTSEPFSSCEDENAMFPDTLLSSLPAKDADSADCKTKDTVPADSNSENPAPNSSNCDNENQRPVTPVSDASPNSKDKREGRGEEEGDVGHLIDTALKGFTRESSKLVTLVQLSLMLGQTSHIRLEYEWRPKRLLNTGLCGGGMSEKDSVTNMLRRLANMATLEYRDTKQRAKQATGGHMSQCTLCGHQLERPTNTRRKTTCDVATETEPLALESDQLAPGALSILRPTKLNSNGTIVGMSTNFVDKETLTPDTDGVFRVPMPLSVPVVRCSSQQRMTAQPTFSQLIRPPEPSPAKNFLIPRKRKQPRKPIIVQRNILPKMPAGQVIFLPQNLPAGSSIEQCILPQSPTITTIADIVAMTRVSNVAPVPGPMLMTMTGVCGVTSVVSAAGTASTAVTSADQLQTSICSVSVSDVLNDSTLDLFASNISMPSLSSSPTKLAQQLTHNSVSLSSFLDISLPAPSNQGPDSGDRFLDMVLVNGNSSGFTGFLKSPSKVNSNMDNNTLSTPPSSPRVSPLKMGADTQWLGGEGPDISLSSLLDTPTKKSDSIDVSSSMVMITSSSAGMPANFIPAPPALFGENSSDSLVAKLDVDTTLHSVMTESSIDYSTKFERLAAHLADNTDNAPTGL